MRETQKKRQHKIRIVRKRNDSVGRSNDPSIFRYLSLMIRHNPQSLRTFNAQTLDE